jgi:hypothetical protein
MFKNRGCHVSIHTNGSHKSQNWWEEIIALLDMQDTMIFSIDGTPDNFMQYRENADWPSIEIGLRTSVAGKNQVVWKYIPFRFNQNTIVEAQTYAMNLGVDEFRITPSNRFNNKYTDHLRPIDELIDWKTTKSIELKQGNQNSIDPRCQDQRQHYISADGKYMPCCFIGEHHFYYKTIFGQRQRDYDINLTTLSRVLEQTKEFYQNLDKSPLGACRFSCPTQG